MPTGTVQTKTGPGRIGTAPVAAPGWTARKDSALRIVDCDVHHSFESPEQLLPYLRSPRSGAWLPAGTRWPCTSP